MAIAALDGRVVISPRSGPGFMYSVSAAHPTWPGTASLPPWPPIRVYAGATRITRDSSEPSASLTTSLVWPTADGAPNPDRLQAGRSIGAGSQHSWVILPWLGATSRT